MGNLRKKKGRTNISKHAVKSEALQRTKYLVGNTNKQFSRVQYIYILQKRKKVEGRSKKKPGKEGDLIFKSLMNNN